VNSFICILNYCMKKSLLVTTITLSISLFFGALAIIIAHLDTEFHFQWLSLSLHFFSVGSILAYAFVHKTIRLSIKSYTEMILVLFVGLVGVVSRFLYLSTYPFVAVMDEVRDAGLDGVKIVSSSIENIFYYGSYEAHGLIIPTISSFFYQYFPQSVMMYRLPTAIIGSGEILLIYLLMRRWSNRYSAVIGSITLATLPLHLFFSRTQLVVILSSFLTTLLLFAFYRHQKDRGIISYASIGMFLGFSLNFHASIRIVTVIITLFVFIFLLFEKKGVINKILKGSLLIAFIIVGFGPRLLFTSPKIFFHTRRLPITEKYQNSSFWTSQSAMKGVNLYKESLLVFVSAPTNFWYSDQKPIFDYVTSSFFIIGLGSLILRKKDPLSYVVIALIFIVPLTNSAFTDVINSDHRISPLYPIGSLVVGIGGYAILQYIKSVILRWVLIAILVLYLLYQVQFFFSNQKAEIASDKSEYLHMQMIYLLQKRNYQGRKICIVSSEEVSHNFQELHHREQREYFLPDTEIFLSTDKRGEENVMIIYQGECLDYHLDPVNIFTLKCNESNKFMCPHDNKVDFYFYYE